MNWNSLLHWALDTAKNEAQKAAIAKIQSAAANLNSAVEAHAPDMQHLIEDQLTKLATTAIAGIATKKA